MFHIPAHRSGTAGQTAPHPGEWVDCPQCGGFPELDEDGRYYTCFFCGDRGFVSLDVAFEHFAAECAGRAADDLRVERIRAELGIPDGYGWRFDEESGEIVLIPPRRPHAAPPAAPSWDYGDDIPF